jgi:serine/threonine-protein kinase RsbW
MVLSFGLYLPRDETSVPVVRHLCRSALTYLGVKDACTHDIELALSEACTNVLQHAADTKDEYVVEVNINDEHCTIDVADAGAGFDDSALPGSAPAAAESGRGIQLMRALVDDLQFVSAPGTGTVVRLTKMLALDSTSPLRGRGLSSGEAVGS